MIVNEQSVVALNPLDIRLDYLRSDYCLATITIPSTIVSLCFEQAAIAQQKIARANGFGSGKIPLEYIKEHFRGNLLAHLREFLFKYCVNNFLHQSIINHKIILAGEPRLIIIKLENPTDSAQYQFEMTVFTDLPHFDWKYLPFKAPKRKNYKDLDRQVRYFIDQEKQNAKQFSQGLATGDWVHFSASLADDKNNLLLQGFKEFYWFKLGDEEVDSELKELFLGKKIGDSFFSSSDGLQYFFSDQINAHYNFYIEISDIVPHSFFCFDHFKRHFRIKTNKDMHKKLIEVFSYRDDISQRRSAVEEALKLMLSKHSFSVPPHCIIREQKALFDAVKNNPDYHVYKAQKDFTHRIEQLAEKQTRESILIDKLAYQEEIPLEMTDVTSYLNLTNRARTKEFIYFNIPQLKIEGQEIPLPTEEIKRTCLREKAINHILYHLTKK